ncbi:hypothetical protein K9N68_10820 [Kovacikia minuta CCNUW1]|uniref:hypothetical protein n=1 Tax=Kovacikia minuta TaxID=2931930 RepID=UPI001CCAD7DB|nr:hypothetical protein [Kovacikia minuta]UBF28321.1 hypothetical protein K9N68_10820 [Kovacikia minuta CCNUW1]
MSDSDDVAIDSATVAVFVDVLSHFLHTWRGKGKPERIELLAMAIALEEIAKSLREEANE